MDPIKDLWFVILAMVLLWFIWFYTGGPQNERAQGGPFLRPPAPLDSGNTYGELPDLEFVSPRDQKYESEKNSSFKNQIAIVDVSEADENDPEEEYIILKRPEKQAGLLYVTGFTVGGASGKKLSIGKASKLPLLSSLNPESGVFLASGDKLILSTGTSPIGVSFQVNACTPILTDSYEFSPSISYPRIAGENDYDDCVDEYKNTPGFYKPEWRLYARLSSPFWKNSGEIFTLYDLAGKIVDIEEN